MSPCELAVSRPSVDAQLLMQAVLRRIGSVAALLLALAFASAVLAALA